MITLGVVSDSHGDTGRLSNIMMMFDYKKVNGVIHLGDGCRDMERFSAGFKQVWQVSGNCDFSSLPREEVITVGGQRIFITHGHRFMVKSSTSLIAAEAEELGVKAALFGHTHQPYIDYHYGILLLNPGAAHDGCYALLRIHDDGFVEGELNRRV